MLLSRTYPPSPELAPYIRRFYIFEAELPIESSIIDRLVSETAFIRVLLRGDWAAEMRPGQWCVAGQTLLFGANSRPLRVRVNGPFTVIGMAIRPSGWRSAFYELASRFTDQMVPLSAAWGDAADHLLQTLESASGDEAIIAAMESAVEHQITRIGPRAPDDAMAAFETIARIDCTMMVEDVADRLGLSVRQFERRCVASFGLTPKMVLRRSRFLDMAAEMRGFGAPHEEYLAALRYFDQSHLSREFKRFLGMTPGAFQSTPTPLFTAGLKLRVEGRPLFEGQDHLRFLPSEIGEAAGETASQT